jgi:hypothetical protein
MQALAHRRRLRAHRDRQRGHQLVERALGGGGKTLVADDTRL